jgi:hypothetical protein
LPDPAIFRKFTKFVKFDPDEPDTAIVQDGSVCCEEIDEQGG